MGVLCLGLILEYLHYASDCQGRSLELLLGLGLTLMHIYHDSACQGMSLGLFKSECQVQGW
jgi:hypothetical protein